MRRSTNYEHFKHIGKLLARSDRQEPHSDAACQIYEEVRPQEGHLDPNVRQSQVKPRVIDIPEERPIRVPLDEDF